MITAQQIERQTYDVPVAARILGVGRNAIYDAAKTGDLNIIKIGRRIVIPKAEIDRLLACSASARVSDEGRK